MLTDEALSVAPGRLGVVVDRQVADVSSTLDILETFSTDAHGDLMCMHLDAVVREIEKRLPNAPLFPLEKVALLSPVAKPSKIIGAPINYRDHIAESRRDSGISHGRNVTSIRDWGLFLKASSSLIGFGEQIDLRFPQRRSDHECELTVVIGKTCRQVSAADAMRYVGGYSIGLD
ncbi:MAG: fumarylacetoacetate hydrolase family protein, partial [Gammaproteobacteria bacterium]